MSVIDAAIRPPLIQGGKTYTDVTTDICRPLENKPTRMWWIGFTLSFLCLLILFATLFWTVWTGIGVWNINKSVMWGWDITNFVFWIGIGHAGTLISAILLLFRQKWRMSINRSAESNDNICSYVRCCISIFSHG